MISLNSTILNLLSQGEVSSFYLVNIANTVYTTDYPYDLTVGADTYESSGILVNIEAPALTSSVDSVEYRIMLADSDNSLASVFETANILSKNATISIGFVDTATKQPLTDPANTVLIYRGRVDSYSKEANTSNYGSTLFVLSCVSPMAALDLKKPYWTSNEFISRYNLNDNSYELSHTGLTKLRLKWGRK
jgi:hypothetical protein